MAFQKGLAGPLDGKEKRTHGSGCGLEGETPCEEYRKELTQELSIWHCLVKINRWSDWISAPVRSKPWNSQNPNRAISSPRWHMNLWRRTTSWMAQIGRASCRERV